MRLKKQTKNKKANKQTKKTENRIDKSVLIYGTISNGPTYL